MAKVNFNQSRVQTNIVVPGSKTEGAQKTSVTGNSNETGALKIKANKFVAAPKVESQTDVDKLVKAAKQAEKDGKLEGTIGTFAKSISLEVTDAEIAGQPAAKLLDSSYVGSVDAG